MKKLTFILLLIPVLISGQVNQSIFRNGISTDSVYLQWVGGVDFDIGKPGYDITFKADTAYFGTSASGGNLIVRSTEGSELAPATIAADTWTTAGGDWTFSGDTATHAATAASTLYPTVAITPVAGNNYKITFDLSGYSAGTITMTFGGVLGTVREENGVFASYVIASTTGNLIFSPTTTFVGAISQVSVKQITRGELIVEGINTFSGRAIVESGSAYAPAIVFSNDANKVGWFRYGATSMGYATDGATRQVFTSSTHWINSDAAIISMGTTLPDLWIGRKAAGNLRLGNIDAASPVAQTLSVQNVITGTTNTAGVDLTIDGSQGTGTGSGGSIIFRTAPAGGSGSTPNALATAMTITDLNLAVNGTITGHTSITLDTDPAIVLSAADCRNAARFNNDADVIDYTLPAAAAGLTILFYDIGGGVITIDPVDGVDEIYLNGTSVGAGDAIDSPGAVGDFICLMAIDDTRWVTVGRSGVWVDGGAD